jgi:hypothetical protein
MVRRYVSSGQGCRNDCGDIRNFPTGSGDRIGVTLGKNTESEFAFIDDIIVVEGNKFTKNYRSISTSGLSSCVCAVAVQFDCNDKCEWVALHHANCGTLTAAFREKFNQGVRPNPGPVYVVVAYRPAALGVDIEGQEREWQAGLEACGVPSDHITFYANSQQSFYLSDKLCVGDMAAGRPAAPPVERVTNEDVVGSLLLSTPQQRPGLFDCFRCKCYITTAVCSSLGLPDDCDDLVTLRWFRDHILRTSPSGERDIREYYTTAPLIVAAINETNDPARIFRAIHDRYLQPAVAAIRGGEYSRAYDLYREMVRSLVRDYI